MTPESRRLNIPGEQSVGKSIPRQAHRFVLKWYYFKSHATPL